MRIAWSMPLDRCYEADSTLSFHPLAKILTETEALAGCFVVRPPGDETLFCGYTILIGYEHKSFACNTRKFGWGLANC